jgi:RNA polymerase sigma factor (TIGR02999 family)
MTDVTQILSAIEQGDPKTADKLLPLVYEELRRLAASRLAREQAGTTLQATALVHEAYLRLVGPDGESQSWNSRGHFFGAAAEAMRRILIDRARAKGAAKRGSNCRKLELKPGLLTIDEVPDELLDLDDAISRFAVEAPEMAELVKLRLFAGLTLAEAAAVLGISERTAKRNWSYARLWLFEALKTK